ncbi:unknown [Fusobacterium nucleatum subsp. nucleatum ATCC 25586]|uniref:Uncharacterized protein n=2 Tax=Fusobacterium nucleatum subsp. nucleatum (strain ATCC 25586 / DSM 15643 / BCRC 10681 / CIP 101130 / JCM 8532 / KCTC 2640 / LMG 13131 / VPI 4355) TaxID=190304 RepID=Q8RE00_FUSNN|nr:unknown [Fusobacterium nucleatum subsp. nucleatum ATCC 25586]
MKKFKIFVIINWFYHKYIILNFKENFQKIYVIYFFKLKMTLNYKKMFFSVIFLFGLNYLICNSPSFFSV